MGKVSFSGIGISFMSAVALSVATAAVHVVGNMSFEDENGNMSEPFFGASYQKTGSIDRNVGNTEYTIRDGLVIEDLPDRENMELDFYIYDFGNQILISDFKYGQTSALTTFNELADTDGNLPVHVEYVRGIACDIAKEYFERAQTPKYDEPPADVKLFHERHCALEMK